MFFFYDVLILLISFSYHGLFQQIYFYNIFSTKMSIFTQLAFSTVIYFYTVLFLLCFLNILFFYKVLFRQCSFPI